MKSRDGKSQRRSEKRREAKRREEKRKSQKEEDPGGRKGRKVTKHCVFPTICGSGWVRSQLARWGMKNCKMLWREAHFQVKSVKNWPVRTTLGSWDDEKLHAVVARSTCPSQKCKSWGVRITLGSWDNPKVHAVVARSTFRSQNVQSTSASDRFWKLRCRKSAYRCGAKPRYARTTFRLSDVVSRGRRKGLCTVSKVSKPWRFWSISKNDGRICKDAFSVAGAVQETYSSELLGGPGADF